MILGNHRRGFLLDLPSLKLAVGESIDLEAWADKQPALKTAADKNAAIKAIVENSEVKAAIAAGKLSLS